jgi:hypothetical protein
MTERAGAEPAGAPHAPLGCADEPADRIAARGPRTRQATEAAQADLRAEPENLVQRILLYLK